MGWICSGSEFASLLNRPPTLIMLVSGSHSGARLTNRLCAGTGFCALRAATSSGKLWSWHALSRTASASLLVIGSLDAESDVAAPWQSCRVASTNSHHELNLVESGRLEAVLTAVRQ